MIPYASRYLTGFLNDRPLAELRDDLARLGFERQPDVREPEDHAAAVCEVMASIVADASPDELDEQQQFFSRHIGPWMQTLFTDLVNAPSARFYRAVGVLGSGVNANRRPLSRRRSSLVSEQTLNKRIERRKFLGAIAAAGHNSSRRRRHCSPGNRRSRTNRPNLKARKRVIGKRPTSAAITKPPGSDSCPKCPKHRAAT